MANPNGAKPKKGFRIPPRTARLVFEGTSYEGAEVVVRLNVPIKLFLEVQDLIDNDRPLETFRMFGESALVSWNLEDDDDKAIPANGAGMEQVDAKFGNLIVDQWVKAAASIDAPLAEQSDAGQLVEEVSTPAAT